MNSRERLARKIERAIEPYILSGRYRELAARRILDCLPRPRREKREKAWGVIVYGILVAIEWNKKVADTYSGDNVAQVPVTITYQLKGKK